MKTVIKHLFTAICVVAILIVLNIGIDAISKFYHFEMIETVLLSIIATAMVGCILLVDVRNDK